MPTLVAGIHVFAATRKTKTWMVGPSPRQSGFGHAGGTSPTMTVTMFYLGRLVHDRRGVA